MRGILAATLLFCVDGLLQAQDAPVVSLGRPVALPADGTPTNVDNANVKLISYQPPTSLPDPAVVQTQAPFQSGPTLAPAPSNYQPAPGPPSPEPYNCGVSNQPPGSSGTGFWDGCKNLWSKGVSVFEPEAGHTPFQSDQAFNEFISPVSNPFFSEDPRALTEFRPIFIFQEAPDHNATFHGATIEFFGAQGRLAVTNWLSFEITKLGGIWFQPHDDAAVGDEGGFAELMLGPKFTVFRCESTGTVVALGLTFDIPAGSSKAFQDTGTLSLIPYVSVAQRVVKTPYGTLNVMDTLGYNVSIDNERTSDIFSSLHFDFDVANLHKIYPLIEFNWFYYTSNGNSAPFDFEGRDLFNFGSMNVSGKTELSMAIGMRYKFCENIQVGLAGEVPLTSPRGLMDYRITFDLIFRF
jgi:hypothetical protein